MRDISDTQTAFKAISFPHAQRVMATAGSVDFAKIAQGLVRDMQRDGISPRFGKALEVFQGIMSAGMTPPKTGPSLNVSRGIKATRQGFNPKCGM